MPPSEQVEGGKEKAQRCLHDERGNFWEEPGSTGGAHSPLETSGKLYDTNVSGAATHSFGPYGL